MSVRVQKLSCLNNNENYVKFKNNQEKFSNAANACALFLPDSVLEGEVAQLGLPPRPVFDGRTGAVARDG